MTEILSAPVSRRLLNLYNWVCEESASADPVVVATELESLRSLILTRGLPSELALYDRFLKLVALRLPGLPTDLNLSATQGKPSSGSMDGAGNCSRTLEQIAPSSASGPALRLLVSGIGRSGTTLIYQQLARLLLMNNCKVNFRYEPYLWNIRKPEVKGNPFDMSQLHQYGMLVHQMVPLLLDGSHPAHDPFIDHLFAEPWDRDDKVKPDAFLTKVIRGSGRLRSYLARYPDLKIVACLRNPLDTINSSLGMFSFFGEEFHADDRPRFRRELEARGRPTRPLDSPPLAIEWYAEWWRVFTEETLSVAADHPQNVFLFCYEAFQHDTNGMLDALMEFVGVRNLGIRMALDAPAGPKILATSLTGHDLHGLDPHMRWYDDAVLRPLLGAAGAQARHDKVVARYRDGRFSFPIAGSDLGRESPIQLRGMMLAGQRSPFMALAQRPAALISLQTLKDAYHKGDAAALYSLDRPAAVLKDGRTFGAVITCYNNASTIVDAVLSCLNQSLPFDQIIIVNDCSSDGSAALLDELAQRYSSLRVLHLSSNLGPAAARDLGIRELSTDFVTQLDGDDLFWPTKNAQEAAVLEGDLTRVAFSDILLVLPDRTEVRSTDAYAGLSGQKMLERLLARTMQIPRDMTFARALYLQAGGYNMTMHLYEDWDFKMRLAACSGSWVRADGLAGTVYNRLAPGLSGVHDELHARALVQIFLRTLAIVPAPSSELLAYFDAALGRFGTRDIARRTRQVLERILSGSAPAQPQVSLLAETAARRDLSVVENTAFAAALEALVQQNMAEVS